MFQVAVETCGRASGPVALLCTGLRTPGRHVSFVGGTQHRCCSGILIKSDKETDTCVLSGTAFGHLASGVQICKNNSWQFKLLFALS